MDGWDFLWNLLFERARHVYWLLLKYSGWSYKQIAKNCNCGHPAVLYGIHSAFNLLSVNDKKIVEIYNKTRHLKTINMSKISQILTLSIPNIYNYTNADSLTQNLQSDITDCPRCQGKGYIRVFVDSGMNPDEVDNTCPVCKGHKRMQASINIEWKPVK